MGVTGSQEIWNQKSRETKGGAKGVKVKSKVVRSKGIKGSKESRVQDQGRDGSVRDTMVKLGVIGQ